MKVDLPDLKGIITSKYTQPGNKVYCDQIMSPTKDCILHIRGKESSVKLLYGGTIFVDHVTNFIVNNHSVNLTAVAIVESKH